MDIFACDICIDDWYSLDYIILDKDLGVYLCRSHFNIINNPDFDYKYDV